MWHGGLGLLRNRFEPTLRANQHLLVASDAAEWVGQCLRLIGSPAQADQLGLAGRKIVAQKFSLDGMAQEVRSTISRVCSVTQ